MWRGGRHGAVCAVLVTPGSLPQLSKPGRLPDAAVPTIQNGAAVADLTWDPFDPRRLAVGTCGGAGRVPQLQACQITTLTTAHPSWCTAGEDARIRLWRIPEGGLQETLQEPEAILRGEGTH